MAGAEYGIDELARAAGTTTRNVRAYRERGLLPDGRRVGRAMVYGDEHLARLKLIDSLLARGFTLGLIDELVQAWESGRDIGALLGLEAALVRPWSDEPASELRPDELLTLFAELGPPGGEADAPATAAELLAGPSVQEAVGLGLIEVDGDEIRVLSPRLLRIGAELVRAGIPLPPILELARQLRDHTDTIATSFVDLAVDHVVRPLLDDVEALDPAALTAVVERLRPLAKAAVDVELSRSLELAVADRLTEVLALLERHRRDHGA